jgi:3-deoxy-D-manno-octulosonic-acid transferase
VVFGPQIENFAEVGEMLVKSGAADYVHDARDMTLKLDLLLSEPERARVMGDRGMETVARLRGSTARTVDIICEVLNGKEGDLSLSPGNELSRKNG